MEEKLSVCIPAYNAADTILETINSILRQTFQDFELVVVDNLSSDNTVELVKCIEDNRIRLYINEKNVGCGGNLERCRERATGDILFYICADDLADIDALRKMYEAFKISEDIGIVTRSYYWFDKDAATPVRVTKQFTENQIVSINDSYEKIRDVIASSGQISGIGLRRRYMNSSFSHEQFVEMANMVVPMLKNCKALILKDNIVAVRIGKSGSMKSIVYKKSPMLRWYNLIVGTFGEDKYAGLRKYLIKNFVANNYIGLVQIKNFGSWMALFREISYLLKLRWTNIFSFRFWFFSIGTIMIPRSILKKMVVFYKNKISIRFFKK